MTVWETIDPWPQPEPPYWGRANRGIYEHITWEEQRRCNGRGHLKRGLGVLIQINNVRQVAMHCLECGAKLSGAIKSAGYDMDALPVYQDNRGVGCGAFHRIEPSRVIYADGRERAVMGCARCKRIMHEPLPEDPATPIDTWPVIDDKRFDSDGYAVSPPCEHCGAHSGTQLHHWAPQSMFTDADRWPISYLCVACHTHWHRKVTPQIMRRNAS